jgi:2-polyprenyl-3-methyl-5-hydroxy-6-metoxy-1,4-benzoquinol methylase
MEYQGKEILHTMEGSKFYNNKTMSLVRPCLHGDILEVGAGIGTFINQLSKAGNLTSVEIDRQNLSHLKKRYSSKAKIGYGDIEKGVYFFPKSKKFDSVISLNVLEHIKDDRAAVKNMYKCLKTGGVCVLLTPAHMFAYGNIDKALGHYRRYTKEGLTEMFIDAGFKIKKCFYFNRLGIFGWYVSGKIFKQKTINRNSLWLFNVLYRLYWPFEKLLNLPFGLSVVVIAEK